MYRKWGGSMPAAVIMPHEQEWVLMTPDSQGDPQVRLLGEDPFRDLIPLPQVGLNAVKADFGYYTSGPKGGRVWPGDRQMRRLAKKFEKGA